MFPIYDFTASKLRDGSYVAACSFCKKSLQNNPKCAQYYETLKPLPVGFHPCPSGFTSYTFFFRQQLWAITGVIAFPRYNTEAERDKAKRFPQLKVSRHDIEAIVGTLQAIDGARADAIQEASKVLPQAFHELRKLNGAILQHAEKQLKVDDGAPALLTIKSAAELMRNNFDILEALSNIEGMRALPVDSTISLLDLVYKTQRVLQERANACHIKLTVTGARAIVRGSQKSFPIVPAVLIENAIKYGKPYTTVAVDISTTSTEAVLTVRNDSEFPIDTVHCFEKGSRYAKGAAEGAGFGLFLAKEIVLAHQGTIRCDTQNYEVVMIVTLPLEKVINGRQH